jgi:hypothetical protein
MRITLAGPEYLFNPPSKLLQVVIWRSQDAEPPLSVRSSAIKLEWDIRRRHENADTTAWASTSAFCS